MYVPFITKTKYRHSFDCTDFPLPSDPTRRFVRPFDREDVITLQNGQQRKEKHFTVEYHIFPWETIKMHHLSWLRSDMRKKVNNWSSKKCFKNYNDLIDKAMDVYEHFDHDSTEEQKASLLFNTPNHEVFVHAFPRQYIHPKFDYMTRLRPAKSYKKIAIMNLSSTNSEVHLFEKLEETGQQTWAKDVIDGKYSNIDYWTVIDCKEDTHIDIDKHIIYVKNDYSKSNIQQLLDRWLMACDTLAKIKHYDYILRTNISTWVNVEFINEMLAYETNDSKIFTFKYCAAFWSTFNIFCSGAAMVWPTRNIPILQDLVNNASKKLLDLAFDDVMMSALWRLRSERLKLNDVCDNWISLEGKNIIEEYNNIKWDNIDFTIPMQQIKTISLNDEAKSKDDKYRLNNDIAKMKEYDKLYREYRNKLSDTEFEEYVKDYMKNKINKNIAVIQYSKQEWLKEAYPNKMNAVYKSFKPYNQETIEWLEKQASNCGYKHTYYENKNKGKN